MAFSHFHLCNCTWAKFSSILKGIYSGNSTFQYIKIILLGDEGWGNWSRLYISGSISNKESIEHALKENINIFVTYGNKQDLLFLGTAVSSDFPLNRNYSDSLNLQNDSVKETINVEEEKEPALPRPPRR